MESSEKTAHRNPPPLSPRNPSQDRGYELWSLIITSSSSISAGVYHTLFLFPPPVSSLMRCNHTFWANPSPIVTTMQEVNLHVNPPSQGLALGPLHAPFARASWRTGCWKDGAMGHRSTCIACIMHGNSSPNVKVQGVPTLRFDEMRAHVRRMHFLLTAAAHAPPAHAIVMLLDSSYIHLGASAFSRFSRGWLLFHCDSPHLPSRVESRCVWVESWSSGLWSRTSFASHRSVLLLLRSGHRVPLIVGNGR